MFKEILGLLKITEEYTIDRNRTTKLVSRDMLIVLTPAVYNKTT